MSAPSALVERNAYDFAGFQDFHPPRLRQGSAKCPSGAKAHVTDTAASPANENPQTSFLPLLGSTYTELFVGTSR